jgi:hypothetical protein
MITQNKNQEINFNNNLEKQNMNEEVCLNYHCQLEDDYSICTLN